MEINVLVFFFSFKNTMKMIIYYGLFNQNLIKEVFTYIDYLYTKGNYRKVT